MTAVVEQRLALTLALAVNVVLLAVYYDRYWYPPDEGSYAHVAERVLDGEVLNRTVQDLHAGYISFLNAGTMAAFGRRMVSLRYPLVALTVIQAFVVFVLFRARGAWLAATAAVAATALGVLQFLNPTAHWYCLALFFTSLLLLERLPPGSRRREWLLGLLLGLTFGLRQLTGVLLAMGVLTYLLLDAGRRAPASGRSTLLARLTLGTMALGLTAYLALATGFVGFGLFGLWPLALLLLGQAAPLPDHRFLRKTLVRLGAGAALAMMPLVAYHLLHGSLASWYGDAVGAAGSVGSLPFIRRLDFGSGLIAGGLAVALRPRSAAWLVNGFFWIVLPLLAAVLGSALVLRSLPSRLAFAMPRSALPTVAAFYAVVSVHFQNSTYLFFALPATVAGLLWLAGEGGRRLRAGAMALATALAAVALYYHAGQTTNRGDLGLLTGERRPVVEAAGMARCGLRIDASDAADYRAALELIERETAPSETIFAVPSNAELYFLSGRKNPFRFFNFAHGVRSEAEARAVLEALARRPPRLVFYDGLDNYNTPLSRWTMVNLARRYELIGLVGRWEVFRLPDAPADGPDGSGG